MAQFPQKSGSGTQVGLPSVASQKSLEQWVQQAIALPEAKVTARLRGNSLYLLIEAAPETEMEQAAQKIQAALAQTPIQPLLPTKAAPVYRLILYSRLPQQSKPVWVRTIELSALGNSNEKDASAKLPVSNLELAQQGHPESISHHLSEMLSQFNISVRTRIDQPGGDRLKRLVVACEATYSPEPTFLAEPIARRLRELKLQNFRDAIVLAQVKGEAKPEWFLRVDLTPPNAVLREWVRWGDVQAIAQLLTQLLAPESIETTAILKDATLHLTCYGAYRRPPDKQTAIAAITPLLESLAPQGIHAATIYGVKGSPKEVRNNPSALPEMPEWVHWLALPAANQPERSLTTLELAQMGNLEAVCFLLERMLNPQLESRLATGGVRVQIRHKDDLLHIMTDSPVCPAQGYITAAVVKCLKPIHIPGIAGVRIYGRRAGQKVPQWSSGRDFVARHRTVPEAAPEFAASEAFLSELLEPGGALVYQNNPPLANNTPVESTPVSSHSRQASLAGLMVGIQRSLIRTHLFAPTAESTTHATQAPGRDAKAPLAMVWLAAGVLLVIQMDWVLGRWLQAPAPKPEAQTAEELLPADSVSAASPAALPNLKLEKNKSQDATAFNDSGFTQNPASAAVTGASPTKLVASPPQPKASVKISHPTFNSRQLDERFAIYRQYLKQHGTPDVLIVGSSRALRGVDPAALQATLRQPGKPPLKIFNFGINGATAQVVDLLVRQMLPEEALPKLIIWADGARAFNSGRPDVTLNGIIASQGYQAFVSGQSPLPGTVVAKADLPAAQPNQADSAMPGNTVQSPIAQQYQQVNNQLNQFLEGFSLVYSQRDQLKEKLGGQLTAVIPKRSPTASDSANTLTDLSNATSPAASAAGAAPVLADGLGNSDYQGFLPLSVQFNPATYYEKYSRVAGDYDLDYENFQLQGTQADALVNVAQFAQERQIALVFVNLPLTKDYLDATRSRYEEAFQTQMQLWAQQYSFVYKDLSQNFLTQNNYFSDPSHLNRYGGYAVAQRLAKDALIPWSQLK